MAWVMIVLGVALTAAGGTAVVHGSPYMQLEFGWTEVIAGTTSITGGIVTVALGAVLRSLAALRRSIEAPRIAASTNGAAKASDAKTPVISDPEDREPTSTDVGTEKPPSLKNRPPVSPGKPAGSRTPQPPSAVPARPARPDPQRAAPLLQAEDASRPDGPGPSLEPAQPVDVPPPSVAGRYESGGSSYLLFSDGSIEVESRTGKHRFQSMEDLKTFVAQEQSESAAPSRQAPTQASAKAY